MSTAYDDTKDAVHDVSISPAPSSSRKNRFQVAHNPSSFAPSSNWSNRDLDPVSPGDRTWATVNYSIYWWSDALALATWELGSSMVSSGLDWKLCIVAVAMGQLIANVVIAWNGTIGARLHIPFPVLVRASFGFYWSYFAIISRLVVGIFWLGITAVSGGQCVNVLLNAIWPSFRNVPNHIPAKMGISTAGMVSYFIYFLIQFPLLLVPWTKIKHVFAFKSLVGLVVMLAIFGNTVSRAGGVAPALLTATSPVVTGSARTWLFFSSMNSVMGAYSTFAVNVPDFARYSKTRNSQWIQCLVSPASMTFIASLGVMTAAASSDVYGQVLWNPTEIIDLWTSRSGRAGAAFCAIGLIFVQVGINIAANSIAAGNDFMVLAPKYINLARGQALAAIAGCWILCPWLVLAQASSFLTFVSQYTIILGPIASIMLFDYWVVKKQKLNVPELYKPHGMYAYNKWGTNWRAFAALLIGSGPGWPGFVNAIQPHIYVTVGAEHIIALGYLYSFALAGVLYLGLSYAFPDPSVMCEEEVTGEEVIAHYDDKDVLEA